MNTKAHEYPCTECGGDAEVGLSGFSKRGVMAYIISPSERLCLMCAKRRGVAFSFQSKPAKDKPAKGE